MQLPSSPACLRNRIPIKEVLKNYLDKGELLEVGHGTCEHAIYFCEEFKKVNWHPADTKEYLYISKQLQNLSLSNFKSPLEINITSDLIKGLENIEQENYDYIFSANTLHIMNSKSSETFCREIPKFLKPQGLLFLYGPFKYNNSFTSKSNESFDKLLRSRNLDQGIRDYEKISELLKGSGMSLLKDWAMPANNQLLVFKK